MRASLIMFFLLLVFHVFLILFTYLKVNIRIWHYLAKYEKVFMSSLKCEYISSYGQRRNISFLKTAHWYGLNFLYLFIRPKNLNLKISENLAALFSERKGINFCRVQMIYVHPLTLNYPLQYAKRLSNIIAR